MWLRNWRMWPCVPFDHKPDPRAPHFCKRCGTQLRDLPAPRLTDSHPHDETPDYDERWRL